MHIVYGWRVCVGWEVQELFRRTSSSRFSNNQTGKKVVRGPSRSIGGTVELCCVTQGSGVSKVTLKQPIRCFLQTFSCPLKGKAKLRNFAINRGLNVLLVCMFSGSFESLDSQLVPVFIFASPALQVHVYWRKNVFSSIQQNIESSYRLYKVTSERHSEMTSPWRSVGLFYLLIDH